MERRHVKTTATATSLRPKKCLWDPRSQYPLVVLIPSECRVRPQVRERHRQLLEKHHQRFHTVWGQLMKTGYQNSRFAHQVERFACLYTSHVSNLSFYSPNKSYRRARPPLSTEESFGAAVLSSGHSGVVGELAGARIIR